MSTTNNVARREYACTKCGHRIITQTNHRGEIYPACEGTCKTIANPNTARERVMWHPQTAHRFIKDIND